MIPPAHAAARYWVSYGKLHDQSIVRPCHRATRPRLSMESYQAVLGFGGTQNCVGAANRDRRNGLASGRYKRLAQHMEPRFLRRTGKQERPRISAADAHVCHACTRVLRDLCLQPLSAANAWIPFYRIERDRLIDNPDQRIAVDLDLFATTTLSLTLDLLSTVETLVWFSIVLWSTAGALVVMAGGSAVQIPGYMLWAAVAYALVGSLLTNKVGHPLVPINYQLQRVEADFRFGLIRLRENAEQIAFYDGMQTEGANAGDRFGRIRENWWQLMRYTKRYSFVVSFYGQLADIFPIVVASPRYFAGALSFGTLMQITDAFGSVSGSLSWFINNYDTVVEWRATVNRLREFKRVMQQPRLKESMSPATEHGGINLHYIDASQLVTHNLALALPNGETLTNVRNIAIKPGSRWLVRGASGAGKSTLLRALAGLWPFGEGSIDAPVDARMMFIPQQSYFPVGTLKAALTYPAAAEVFSDEDCCEALHACRLEDYVDRLQESGDWARVLSPGEQQRLVAVRVLLHEPDYVFLDEATSALDSENEAHLYGILSERLPKAAIVSIAQRESLAQFHQETLDITRHHRASVERSEAETAGR
jgi:putative ATP-binding cassette transporter